MRFGPQKPDDRNSRRANRAAQSQPPASRSDEIRSRRAQKSQEQINKVASRISNPPPARSRPVTVRKSAARSFAGSSVFHSGRDAAASVRQVAGTRARRQFYLTMDRSAGTEIRLPAVPMIRPGWRLLSFLLAALMAFGIYSMWSSPYTQVQSVEVQGIERIKPEEIAATLMAKLNLENQSIVAVDPAQAQEIVAAAYPDLMNVQVSVSLPDVVTVSAEERQPVLAIQQGDKVTWVDESGVLFPARGDAGKLVTIQAKDGLPLAPAPLDASAQATQDAATTEGDLTAPASSNTKGVGASTVNPVPVTGVVRVDPTVLAALEGLSKKLPPRTQLVYSMTDGLGWQAPEGWQVFIGKDLSDFEAKYTMYQQMAAALDKEGIKASVVSVAQLDAPYYRTEQ